MLLGPSRPLGIDTGKLKIRQPSSPPRSLPTRLVRVGELVGIEVLDHVILAGDRYFSFREEGLVGK